MNDAIPDEFLLGSNGSIRALTRDEVEYRKRFDVPGLWPPSATSEECENYMLWSYIQHVRARWDRQSRRLRPSLWLRLRVWMRFAWLVVKAMDGDPPRVG